MNTTGNTVFISGGSAGIGFEIAKLLSERGNKVIINGRNRDRLEKALEQLTNAEAIQGDLSVESERFRIAEILFKAHPETNVIINNAGEAYEYYLNKGEGTYLNAAREINTNYIAIVHFTELLLPDLLKKQQSAVINVSSRAALRSTEILPTYSASKAALHSYTQTLRRALSQTNIKIFELIPPLVNTDFSAGIGGAAHGIPPQEVADELLKAWGNDQFGVPVGLTKPIYTALKEAFERLSIFG